MEKKGQLSGSRPGRRSPESPERALLRRKRWRLGLLALAVLLPLVILQILQYCWLVELQEHSAVARRSRLSHDLDTVAEKIYYIYREDAFKSLKISPDALKPEWFHKAPYFFKKNPAEGAERRFLVNFLTDPPGQLLFYHPESNTLEPPEEGEVPASLSVAMAPWTVNALKVGGASGPDLVVDAWNPDYRLILKPVSDEDERLVGVVGYVVDPQVIVDRFLPLVLEKVFSKLGYEKDVLLTVRDGDGKLILSWGQGPEAPAWGSDAGEKRREIGRSLGFVFKDWYLTLEGGDAKLRRLAEASFATNLTLSILLSALILVGVVLLLRTMAREMKLIEMKNDFVSNVSHELRTPLASIRVFGELLRLGRVDSGEKAREYGEYIETESRRLTQLINNILDFSRIESGHRRYHFEPTDLRDVIGDALKTFEVRLQKEGFEVSLDEPEEPLPVLSADAGALGQAVCNLLDNAIKYSNGGRRIEVSLGSEKGRAVLAVKDFGVGISREEQKRIFERFHRVGTSLVHDVKGSGLGLSIVQHVVEAHGGRVRVESAPGEGSTFSILLPLEGPPSTEEPP